MDTQQLLETLLKFSPPESGAVYKHFHTSYTVKQLLALTFKMLFSNKCSLLCRFII